MLIAEALSICQDCRKIWKASELADITHGIFERVSPGEPMPSGECPDTDCGALCQPIASDHPSAFEIGNQHGYLCPSCTKGDKLYISATVTAALLPDGSDTTDSDTEWEVGDPAWCGCGWRGKVENLIVIELSE